MLNGSEHYCTLTVVDCCPPSPLNTTTTPPTTATKANNTRCFLSQSSANNRRHSSEVKAILPKISISRAKSDLNLVLKTSIHQAMDGGTNDEGKTSAHTNLETHRTNMAIQNLANYITRKPNYLLKNHRYQCLTKILYLKSPPKCRICLETIYFQCYECTQCRLAGHKKCLQSLYIKCPNKPMPPRLAVFGLDITDCSQISEVLTVCITDIENRPMNKLKGLYKIESNQTKVESLCFSFEFGPHLIDLSQVNVHDITGVVKEYLLRLSTPIFSSQLQSELITLGKEWPVRKVPYTQSGMAILVFELRRLISFLSPAYRNNLAYLIYHLKRVADKQNITEMSANSLGIVFANIIFRSERKEVCNKNEQETQYRPNIFHSNRRRISTSIDEYLNNKSQKVQIVLDATFKIRVIELMILYANDVFG